MEILINKFNKKLSQSVLILTLVAGGASAAAAKVKPKAPERAPCEEQLGTPEEVSARLQKMTLQEVYALPLDQVQKLYAASGRMYCIDEEMASQPGTAKKLSGIERCALYSYTIADFAINKQLWDTENGEGLSGEDWAYIRVLDAALAKIPSGKPKRVYRGTSQNKPELPRPGEVVRFKGYTSTSEDIEIAKFFLNGEADRLMVIDTLNAKDLSGKAGVLEREFLLPRSTYLRYERSEWKTIEVYNESEQRDEKRRVEFVYLTEVPVKR